MIYKVIVDGVERDANDEEAAIIAADHAAIAVEQENMVRNKYQRDRAAEYPPMADYLDGIVKGNQEQVQAYIDACLAVKAKYPKPE